MSEKTYEQTALKGIQFELDPYENMGFGEHEGYTFSGWRDESETHVFADRQPVTFNENTDLYAIWQVNQYTQTFNPNGGQITYGSSTVTQDYGTALTPPLVVKTGYSLNGWNPSVPQTVPASNNTYTAQWEANTYQVSFNLNYQDATNTPLPKTVTFDHPYGQLPDPVRTGYIFSGWYNGNTQVTENTLVKTPNNHTLSAHWSEDLITITFHENFDVDETEESNPQSTDEIQDGEEEG